MSNFRKKYTLYCVASHFTCLRLVATRVNWRRTYFFQNTFVFMRWISKNRFDPLTAWVHNPTHTPRVRRLFDNLLLAPPSPPPKNGYIFQIVNYTGNLSQSLQLWQLHKRIRGQLKFLMIFLFFKFYSYILRQNYVNLNIRENNFESFVEGKNSYYSTLF